MARPTSRTTFKDYCLRNLGAPVIDINVDAEQVEDRIDEALQYFRDYHFDGVEKLYLKHQITAEDKVNKYIDVDDSIQGVVGIFPVGSWISSNNMFSYRYQMALSDLFDFKSATAQNYVMAMRQVAELQSHFAGQTPIRFNRHTDKLYLDLDWEMDLTVGDYIIIECYAVVDPNVYTNVWSDRWLGKYCTALIKRQWGNNLKKFSGMTLPGGITFNGQDIYNEAEAEIKDLELEMINSYSMPVADMTG